MSAIERVSKSKCHAVIRVRRVKIGVSAKDTKQADGYSDRKGEYKTLGRDSLGLSN
jgi:hypothetical protein